MRFYVVGKAIVDIVLDIEYLVEEVGFLIDCFGCCLDNNVCFYVEVVVIYQVMVGKIFR